MRKIGGPQKVYTNLIKGLDKIGYPYVVNCNLNATKRLWVHDDIAALRYLGKTTARTLVGPNLFVMPKDIPREIIKGGNLQNVLYLMPSQWSIDLWKAAGFNTCPLYPWPVGIDTNHFQHVETQNSAKKVLVYHKLRDHKEFDYILDILKRYDIQYDVMIYGNYTEDDFLKALRQTSFIIWHGIHESQGIALQEALACNVPILICDVVSVLEEVGGSYVLQEETVAVKATAAPFFDERCGVKILDLSLFERAIEFMQDNLGHFAPRDFVLENLSLEGQAKKLLSFWDHWNMSFEAGLHEQLLSSGKWPQFYKRLWRSTRPALKKIKNKLIE